MPSPSRLTPVMCNSFRLSRGIPSDVASDFNASFTRASWSMAWCKLSMTDRTPAMSLKVNTCKTTLLTIPLLDDRIKGHIESENRDIISIENIRNSGEVIESEDKISGAIGNIQFLARGNSISLVSMIKEFDYNVDSVNESYKPEESIKPVSWFILNAIHDFPYDGSSSEFICEFNSPGDGCDIHLDSIFPKLKINGDKHEIVMNQKDIIFHVTHGKSMLDELLY